jgi:peptidyl-prolyl cis-trans isomerase D
MALIGKIRQRTGLLLGFIGLALLIFLVQAALNDGASFGGGKQAAGKINGKKITLQDFSVAMGEYDKRIAALNPNLPKDEETQQSIRDEVWNNFITQELLGKTFESLALGVSDKELKDAFTGNHIHPLVTNIFSRNFANQQTGEFDRIQFDQALRNMDKMDPSGQFRTLVAELEKLIEEDRTKTKYAALVSKSLYVPTFMADDSYKSNQSAIADVVFIPTSTITDDQVKVTDDEIKEYISKHPGRFKQKNSRVVDIVTFDLVPSDSDMADINNRLNALVEEFKTTTEDSLFIVRNTLQGNNLSYYSAQELSAKPVAAEIIAAAPGAYIGPYREGSNMIVTKVLDKKIVPDSVTASHILLSVKSVEELEAANKLADSIIADLKAGKGSFADKAMQYSTDDDSKVQGGSLGTFPKNVMVKPFNDKVFYDMGVGQLAKVESQFGVHVILKTGQTGGAPASKIADVYVEIAPSDATSKEILEKANDFLRRSPDATSFDKSSRGMPIQKDVELSTNQVSIPGVGVSRAMVSWAYSQEEPGVVSFFDVDDKFAVVKLKSIKKEGLASVDDARQQVTSLLRDQKKAEILRKKLESAAKGNTPLDQVAAITGGQYKAAVPVQFSSDYVDGVGIEPKLVGTVFGVGQGKTSKAIAGALNAFIVTPISVMSPDVATDVKLYKAQVARMLSARLNYSSILKSLEDNAKVVDERYLF